MNDEESPRLKPSHMNYPAWDAPEFDPEKFYIRPKAGSPNRSSMARIYETVLESLANARKKIVEE